MENFKRDTVCDDSLKDVCTHYDTESFGGIGPVLPPHLRKKQCMKCNTTSKEDKCPDSQNTIGPTLPPHMKPTGVDKMENIDTKSQSRVHAGKLYSENEMCLGPQLPPHLQGSTENNEEEEEDDEELYGPALPPSCKYKISEASNYEESDDVYGPLPFQENSDASSQDIQQSFDRRAQLMKQKLSGKNEDKFPKREEWMLELPEEHALKFGLGPRQFQRRETASSGDRSVWTDTPADRERKKNKQEHNSTSKTDMQEISVAARDNKMLELAESYSGMRPQESLLDSHQKELKRKRKKDAEEGKQQERRPFDRNIDLQANQLNEAQKQGVFKMAHLLNDRFASGKSKFL